MPLDQTPTNAAEFQPKLDVNLISHVSTTESQYSAHVLYQRDQNYDLLIKFVRLFRLVSFAWDLAFGIFRWIFVWDLLLGIFGWGSFVWDPPFGIFRLRSSFEIFRLRSSFGHFRLRSSRGIFCFGIFRLGSSLETFVWYLSLGIFRLEKLAPDAGGTAGRILVNLGGVPHVGWC